MLSVEPEKAAILTALATARSESFRESLRGMENLYGDGRSAERIASVLAGVPLDEQLLIKRGRPAGT